jgi:hypothetical protein
VADLQPRKLVAEAMTMTADRRAALKAAVADHIARDQGCSMREAEDMADYIVTLIRAETLEEAVKAAVLSEDGIKDGSIMDDIRKRIRALKEDNNGR